MNRGEARLPDVSRMRQNTLVNLVDVLSDRSSGSRKATIASASALLAGAGDIIIAIVVDRAF